MEELNKEVLKKIDELINIIKSTDEYKKYISINNKLKSNTNIKEKIDLIKKTQKELVKCEYYNDIEKKNILENSLKKMNEELDNIPIYNEYKHVIEELNELVYPINNLEDYLESLTK